MATASASYTYTTQDTNGQPSTFELTLTADSPLGNAGTVLDAFCGNIELPILGYRQGVYSGDYTDLASAGFSLAGSINWLLNAYPQGLTGFPPNAVQAAIWVMLGQDWTHTDGFAGYSPADAAQVHQLVGQALAHQSFVPAAGESMAILIDTMVGGQHSQPMLVEVKAAQLGDRVWSDLDADGVQDANEAGIAGAKVELLRDLNGDGKYNGVGEVTATTTDGNGNYSFKGLTPGMDYQVRFTTPDGFTDASPRQSDGNSGSGTNSDGSLSDVVVLKPGENNTSLDAGFYKDLRNASLGDRVWSDLDRDGVQDEGESGRGGVRVELYTSVNGQPGTLVATQITDANGNYKFTDLKGGDYQVKFITPTGQVITQQNVGDDARDSDAGANGLTAPIKLAAGEYNATIDAGIHGTGTGAIGDFVWFDADKDGFQDAGEKGAAGVKVSLVGAGADGKFGTGDDVTGSTVTDANGKYLFSGLDAGKYELTFEKPVDTDFTTYKPTVSYAINSNADPETGKSGVITLDKGEVDKDWDAGLISHDKTSGDSVKLCEDTSKLFNVLSNDQVGLRLISVKHESSSLDSTFKSNGGAISFTEDGSVTYKSMKNYYGNDKLVYVAEDSNGQRYTQTVDMSITAVSDAGTAKSIYDINVNDRITIKKDAAGVEHRIMTYKLSDFGTFSDAADKLQTFGSYNSKGVSSDADTLAFVRVTGVNAYLYDKPSVAVAADLVYRGEVLDFSRGQHYDIPVADINAGLLKMDGTGRYVRVDVAFQVGDTGEVENSACYDGSIVSGCYTASDAYSPIALDLNGDGRIGVTGVTASYQKDAGAELGRTVQFDIDADGHKDTIEWFNGSGDGILIDNRDGLAATDMDGARLFGDQGGAFGNGYYKLELLDANGDGKLLGDELKGLDVWIDNGDAIVQDGEILSLADVGIVQIDTGLTLTTDAQGKVHIESSAMRADGSSVMTEDVYFAGTSGQAATPSLGDLVSDDASLDQVLGVSEASTQAVAADVAAEVASSAETAELMRRLLATAGDAVAA